MDQSNRLANGHNCATDCATFDLTSIVKVASADPCCKARKESDLLREVGILKIRVHSHRRDIFLPVGPIFSPAAGSRLQSSSVKDCIRSTEITCVAIAEVGWQTVHEFCLGRGKLQLKKISNSFSDLKCHFGSIPNEREGISVIKFWLPAMCSVVIGQTFCKLKCSARMRMSCSAMRLDRQAMRSTQLTVGLLSLNSATCFSVRVPQTCSIMSHRMTSPASSRSELVNDPFGLLSKITLAVMSGGHWSLKTVGGHSASSPMITPPMPWLDASTTPTKSGQPATSLQHRVRGLVDSQSIVWQFDNADRRGSFLCRKTTGGQSVRRLLVGERGPWPPGRATNACLSFATTNSIPQMVCPGQGCLTVSIREGWLGAWHASPP